MKGNTRPVELARDVAPWSFAALAVLVDLLLGSRVPGLQFLPWVVGLLFFGLPHGACDHLVAARLTGRRSPTDAVAFFAVYLTASAAMLLLWLASPSAALVAFLVLTAWHWGSADAIADQDGAYRDGAYRNGIHRDGLFRFFAASVARGLLVVSAPVAFDPAAGWDAFGVVMSSFGEASPESPVWLAPLATGCLVLSVTLECSLVCMDFALGRKSRAVVGVTELLLLLGLFYIVSPVAAVGIYFVFWHAWRHVLRVGRTSLSHGARKEPNAAALISAYHVEALPLTALSLVMLVVLSVLVGASDAGRLAGLYLVLISALTLPHAILVFFWDLRTVGSGTR